MSVFLYGIEVWGAAYQQKYLEKIESSPKRAHGWSCEAAWENNLQPAFWAGNQTG